MKKGDLQRAFLAPARLIAWGVDALRRRDPHLWVFGAWYGSLYSDNSRAMYEYVCAYHPEITAVWITSSRSVYDRLKGEGRRVEYASSRAGRAACRRASAAFASTAASDVNERCLNGCRLVMLWHGSPIKLIGNDARRFMVRDTLWKRVKTAARRIFMPWEFIRYDMVCNISEFFNPIFRSAFAVDDGAIAITGLPRNDALFEGGDALVRKIEERWKGCVKIVYMPTFRDTASGRRRPFNPFAGFGFDAARLSEILVRRNMVFIYKGHYYDQRNGSSRIEGVSDRFLNLSDGDYDNLYSFLGGIDILITDYSSLFFDFIITGRRVILAPFDYDEYIAHARPLYFDYSLLEGPRAHNWDELCALLDNGGAAPAPTACVKRFNAHSDERSRERVFCEVQTRFFKE